jgi:hypothetical protein
MSIWLIQPTPIRFTIAFHALTHLESREIDPPVIMASPREPPLWCHPRDGSNPILPRHLIKAAKLFERLSIVPRKNDVWAALRAFWAALASYQPDYRYPVFWQGIESLFGSAKTWKVSPRIRDRLSYFLADTPAMREKICDMVEACYKNTLRNRPRPLERRTRTGRSHIRNRGHRANCRSTHRGQTRHACRVSLSETRRLP